jgi:hypothetical protein
MKVIGEKSESAALVEAQPQKPAKAYSQRRERATAAL